MLLPNGGTLSYTYNAAGQLLTTTEPTTPSVVYISNTYDPSGSGNLISSALNPTGINSITSYSSYSANGDLLTIIDPNQNATEFVYDLDRRNTETHHHNGSLSAPLFAAERSQYDVLGRDFESDGGTAFSGNSATTWQALSSRTYTHNDKVQTEQNGAGNTSQYLYDGVDRTLIVTDAALRNLASVYDLAGETLCTWRGWSSTVVAPTSCSWTPSAYTSPAAPLRYAAYSYGNDGEQGPRLRMVGNLLAARYPSGSD